MPRGKNDFAELSQNLIRDLDINLDHQNNYVGRSNWLLEKFFAATFIMLEHSTFLIIQQNYF